MNGQTQRIIEYLKQFPNQDVAVVTLHAVGSGKEHGFCASLSRRISDCRALGHDVRVCRDEWVGTQRRTWYKLVVTEKGVSDEKPAT